MILREVVWTVSGVERFWTLSGVEGVPAGHIVHFILDAVEQLPITDFRVNEARERQRAISPEDDACVVEVMGFRRFSLRAMQKFTGVDPGLREL